MNELHLEFHLVELDYRKEPFFLGSEVVSCADILC